MNHWPRFGLLCLLLAVPRAEGQLSPEKAEKSFTVSDGLAISLWASEPLFVNPTCMDVDHQGRVWVCESVNYRNKLRGKKTLTRPQGDRIVILEDSTGSGKADKATTFYQSPDTLAPLGIAVAKDPSGPGWKVFVCQSPDILVFDDKDGDGKADGPPTKLLTGFRGFDHDHGVHGILIGPDNKLYFSVGDQGVSGLQSSDRQGRKWTSNSTDCRAGTIWRCDTDGKNLELIAHNFRNEYEPCVDSFGNVFVSDNDDDGNQQTRICFVMPGGNYGYHPRGRGETHWHEEQPGVVPKILRTYFGSPTGMCVYEGTLLPKKYHGQPLHTDAGPRHVRCYHLKPQGAGFAVEREDMVSSTDNWFRPADVCVAPDGSVFVADWYDPGVGGHGMGDITRGRVYRITPKGHAGYKVPKVDLETAEGVRSALASPALSVRAMAMAQLAAMKPADALAALLPGIQQKENPWLRARALWQYARLGGWRGVAGAHEYYKKAVEDKDEHLQILCLRILKDVFKAAPGVNYELIKPGTAVAREALLLLRDVDSARSNKTILELMKAYDGKDRFYLAAVGIAVGQDPARREAILADFDKHFKGWDDRVAGLVWELRPPGALPLLEKRLADARVPVEQRVQALDVLVTSADERVATAMLNLLGPEVPAQIRDRTVEHLQQFLPGKWQKLAKSAELTRALDALFARPDARVTALALTAAAGRDDRLGEVLKLARAAAEPAAVRKAAFVTLGQLPSDRSVTALAELAGQVAAELQPAATQALGELARRPKDPLAKKAVAALTDLVSSPKITLVLRELAVSALASSRPGSVWLLEANAKSSLPADLVATTGRLLRNSSYPDLQNRALIAFPAPGKINLQKLPAIAVLATRKGDAVKGKKLFDQSAKSNLQCLKCHMVRGSGGQVGPDLSMIGKKASRENLFESILYPSKAIADQYITWVIETSKGLAVQGLLVEETAEVVVLRDAEGRDIRVAKKDIENRAKGPKSLMAEDLAVHFSEEELIDTVEYLLTLKTPALTPDSWDIAGPFDNGSSMEGLDRVFGPEKEVDLKATYAGKHGKVSWRKVRPGAAGYVDLQAFFAPQSNHIVSYLTAQIESPVDQDATVLFGSDDGAKVWVNGALVHTTRTTRAAAPEQETVKVKLKKGANRILVKVNNGDGGHGLYFTLVSEQELKQAGKK